MNGWFRVPRERDHHNDLGKIARKLDKKSKRPEWLDEVDARDLLEELGVEKISESSFDELNFSCPFPGHSHGDETPSAYMNNGAKSKHLNTAWKCWGCGRKGNAISFVADFAGVSRQKASSDLREKYAPGWRKPKGGSMSMEWKLRQQRRAALEREERPPEIPVLDWDDYHERYSYPWVTAAQDEPDLLPVQYMLGRGFKPSELERWCFGVDGYSNRITIPVCTPEGDLIGVKGRTWQPVTKSKYMIFGDTEKTLRNKNRPPYGFEPYPKSAVVYGLDIWGEQETYVWDEGELNVKSFEVMGIPALATGSASMSIWQASIIRDYCNELVIFIDNDDAGDTGIWGYTDDEGEYHPGAVAMLEPYIKVRIVGTHWYDANDFMRRDEKHWNRVRTLISEARPAWQLQLERSSL